MGNLTIAEVVEFYGSQGYEVVKGSVSNDQNNVVTLRFERGEV